MTDKEIIKALECLVKTAKAKAIKDFAERLKRTDLALCGKDIWCEYIDNLVKEMVGDEKWEN